VIRSFGKVHVLAWAVLSTSALVNCSADKPKHGLGANAEESGNIGLELQLPNGTHADTAHYSIMGPNGFALQGDFDISNSPSVSALIGGIPPGSGYSITVTVSSTDATTNCTGQATFAVASRATTNVDVVLRCRTRPNTGSIIINGTLNLCPTIDMIGALPLTAKIGSPIALTSLASDDDHVPSAVSYHWTGPFGFDTTTPNATFGCSVVGAHTITLTVTDGDPGCEATSTAMVTCNADSGPGTDGGAGSGGSGGTGTGGAAGAGTGGSAGSAGSSDAGTGGTAGATGGTGGTGGATGGTAGTGGSGGTGMPDAGPDGHIVTVEEILAAKSAACLSCAQANCATEIGGCLALRGQPAAAGPATGTSRETLCTDALACVIPPGATASCNTNFLNACYCGSALNEACLMAGSATVFASRRSRPGSRRPTPGQSPFRSRRRRSAQVRPCSSPNVSTTPAGAVFNRSRRILSATPKERGGERRSAASFLSRLNSRNRSRYEAGAPQAAPDSRHAFANSAPRNRNIRFTPATRALR
jgi:hypothetical protein